MRNAEILKLAVQKVAGTDKKLYKGVWCNEEDPHYWEMVIAEGLAEHILLNHDFAKAFWGEEYMNNEEFTMFDHNHTFIGYVGRDIQSWQYHLKQMVLEEDPIKYLEKYI